MKYRIRLKIGWSGKHWYLVQKKFLGFLWIDIHDYESLEQAELIVQELSQVNI